MTITVTFDPPLPSDSPATFNTKAFTLLGDLNDWSTQANALPAELAVDLVAERSATATLTNKTLTNPSYSGTTANGGTITTIDINGGTIDGTVIGGASPAAGSFTTLSASGAVTIPGTLSVTGGTFGYGTGAGGTVTQATSKSTAVTLHKPCGQITMNNAALAAGATESFYLYSSYIDGNSIVLVQGIHDGSVNPANYEFYSSQVYGPTNRALIKFTNVSAGSLSEAVVIQFAIIKGSTT